MMMLELPALSALAILAMAVATFLIRASGFWLMGHVAITARVRRMLEALPGSIVAAIVLPLVVKGGIVAVFAIAAALGSMVLSRNELAAVAVAVAVAAFARGVGI